MSKLVKIVKGDSIEIKLSTEKLRVGTTYFVDVRTSTKTGRVTSNSFAVEIIKPFPKRKLA